MAHFPGKRAAPIWLDGKRTGRPKGSRNWARAWKDCLWGLEHAQDEDAKPPTAGAALWQAFAAVNYWEVHDWLEEHGVI